MEVHLAGYNVDTEVLRELTEKAGQRQDLTPEVISAAYARISRDPRPVNEIRKEARKEVEKARRSNKTIIFKMGHHSVAEHAVFNLDILGVSRLAMEELEKFRLCSYTEKSQRYITLDKGFIIPAEIKGTALEKVFREMVRKQNQAYGLFFDKLKSYVLEQYPQLAADPKKHNLLEGWAKEDARYITPLTTETQVGETINARNLELLLRRFASHPLLEVRELGEAIYRKIAQVAPSIVIFYAANDRDLKTYRCLKETGRKLTEGVSGGALPEAELVEFTEDGDAIIAASLLHTVTELSYRECKALVDKLALPEKEKIFKAAWENLEFYDSLPREFEYVNLTFNITLSAACFGQLKRHRMTTLTVQPYDPALGVTLPESIKAIGMEEVFKDIIGQTNAVYEAIDKEIPLAAPYILTNAHRRRVLVRVNARELYHISRLREDVHAQWDIRNISRLLTAAAKKVMPLTFGLSGGKDSYGEVYQRIFGRPPKVAQAVLPGERSIK